MNFTTEHFAERLSEIMDEKDVRVTELSDALGYTYASTVSKWSHGAYLPDLYNFVKICNVLGVSPDYFLEGDDERKSKQ